MTLEEEGPRVRGLRAGGREEEEGEEAVHASAPAQTSVGDRMCTKEEWPIFRKNT